MEKKAIISVKSSSNLDPNEAIEVVTPGLFIINDEEDKISETIQTNMEILRYVQKKYHIKYSSSIFSVYTN